MSYDKKYFARGAISSRRLIIKYSTIAARSHCQKDDGRDPFDVARHI
jgi:hypothetical protein